MQPQQHRVQPSDSRSTERQSDGSYRIAFRLLSERSRVRLAPGARSNSTTIAPSEGGCVANASAKRRTAVILHAALLPLLALAAVIVGVTHDAPEGDYQKIRGDVAWQMFVESRNLGEPGNQPEWSWVAADYPACSPKTDVLAEDVVVVDSGADASRIDFDRAWDLNHDDERANDVWVVGTC